MPEAVRDPIIRTVPQPADMNGNGDIFGGWVLSQMDIAGGTLAARAAKGRVATVAITAMTFVQPIKVGDLVSIYGEVSKIGRSSITIALETVVQRHSRIGMTQIVVLPYYLFTGTLIERIQRQIVHLRQQYPLLRFGLGGYFGFEQEIFGLLDERVHGSRADGTAPAEHMMECDGCKYRDLAESHESHHHDHSHDHGHTHVHAVPA